MSFASVRVSIRLCVVIAASSWCVGPAFAQGEYQVLHRFEHGDSLTPGLTVGPDGALYGTEPRGGSMPTGTVYKIDIDGTYVRLHEFNYADGYTPYGALTLGPGGLYGTTASGTVFRVTADGAFTTIHSPTGADGVRPAGRLALGHDGALYGVTWSGGTGRGGVFRMDADGAVTLLHAFTSGDVGYGQYHDAWLSVAADGAMYGVIAFGGAHRNGLVYRVKSNGEFVRLHSFQWEVPYAYWVHHEGGRWPIAPPTPTADGALYGVTAAGGGWQDAGTVYRIAPDGTFSIIHRFDGLDGAVPSSALVADDDGRLYGTTFGHPYFGTKGSIFKVESDGTVSTLHAFSGGDGAEPQTPMLKAGDRVYGVSSRGGQTDCGTLFSITRGGAFETHLSFGCENSGYPRGGLTEGPSGALYGATATEVFRWFDPDETAPTIVAELMSAPNYTGWHTEDVIVHFTCTDDQGGWGIPEGACPADQVLSAEGADVRSTAMTVTDAAGNVSLPSNVVAVKIDKTAPTLAPTVSPSVVTLKGSVAVDARGSDAVAGITYQACTPIDTYVVGPKWVTCWVGDAAGHYAMASTSYLVQYGFSGFQQPVNDPANAACTGCPLSVFLDGSTIRARFQLMDASGAVAVSRTAPRWLPPVQVGTTTARLNERVERDEPSSGTTFQLIGTEYVYNWVPRGLPRGSVWRIGVALEDGQQYTVDVAVR